MKKLTINGESCFVNSIEYGRLLSSGSWQVVRKGESDGIIFMGVGYPHGAYTIEEVDEAQNMNAITDNIQNASDRIASGWNADTVCVAGQYKVDNGNLYKCRINNVNTPTSDTYYWQKTDIATELNNLLALINANA